jgi:phosphoribosyl-dephospho-CoA transferase
MIARSYQNNQRVRRHDLIFVSPVAWHSLIKTRADLFEEPLVVDWAGRGWPLVARRAMPDDTVGVALGLPLPPFAGKRRLSFLMQPDDIVSTAPLLELSATINIAPECPGGTLWIKWQTWLRGMAWRRESSAVWRGRCSQD